MIKALDLPIPNGKEPKFGRICKKTVKKVAVSPHLTKPCLLMVHVTPRIFRANEDGQIALGNTPNLTSGEAVAQLGRQSKVSVRTDARTDTSTVKVGERPTAI
jgi:hypothetical protein